MAIQIHTFSKKWLLQLADTQPTKRTEYRDSEYKYLRARVTPKGYVSLSVVKAPRGHQTPARKSLPITVDKHLPPMSQIRAIAAELVAEIDSGVIKGKPTTLEAGLQELLKASQLKERTEAAYKWNVNEHLKDWKAKPMTGDANAILKKHRAITKKSGPVAANNALRTYRRILNYCGATNESVPVWPAPQLRVMKLWAAEEARTNRRLERESFPDVWEAIGELDPLWADLFTFYLLTGCRRREATNLTVDDVNFRAKTVTFTDTKNKLAHTLPLTDTLSEILKRRKDSAVDGKLFPVNEPKNITKHIERKTDVHLTPHDCRRTFAGVAELAGVGSHTVSVLLNHKSGNVTAGYIGTLDNTAKRESLKKIEEKITEFAAKNAEN